ncbi:hypothetical protein BDI4_1490002 [Burkholderia diffusa]|nr:hypothetical protein BDI4_1490002 [Burkholderia diffusa]
MASGYPFALIEFGSRFGSAVIPGDSSQPLSVHYYQSITDCYDITDGDDLYLEFAAWRGYARPQNEKGLRRETQALEFFGGRYWDRTSDPCRVKAVLYR